MDVDRPELCCCTVRGSIRVDRSYFRVCWNGIKERGGASPVDNRPIKRNSGDGICEDEIPSFLLSRKISRSRITVAHKRIAFGGKAWSVFGFRVLLFDEMVESSEGGSRSTVHANFAFDSMNKGAPLPATYCRLHTELPDQKQLSSRLSSAATRLVRAQGFSFRLFHSRSIISTIISRSPLLLADPRGKNYTFFLGEGMKLIALIFKGC